MHHRSSAGDTTIADAAASVTVDERGRLVSLRSLPLEVELIHEPRLAGSFRVSLPLKGKLDHLIEGVDQDVEVDRTSDRSLAIRVRRLESEYGLFDVAATFGIVLHDGAVCFSYEFEN